MTFAGGDVSVTSAPPADTGFSTSLSSTFSQYTQHDAKALEMTLFTSLENWKSFAIPGLFLEEQALAMAVAPADAMFTTTASTAD